MRRKPVVRSCQPARHEHYIKRKYGRVKRYSAAGFRRRHDGLNQLLRNKRLAHSAACSFELDLGNLDHLRPFLDFGFLKGAELVYRHGGRLQDRSS